MDKYSGALQSRQSREFDQRLLALDRARTLDPGVHVSSQVRLEPMHLQSDWSQLPFERHLPSREIAVYFGSGSDVVPYVLYPDYDWVLGSTEFRTTAKNPAAFNAAGSH